MFPFLKSRRKKHEIQVIDLTIGSTLEDDYILPTRLVHELSVKVFEQIVLQLLPNKESPNGNKIFHKIYQK